MTSGLETAHDRGMARAPREVGRARLVFAATAWVFVACLVVQVFLVGLDIFAKLDGSVHRDFAYLFGWLAPVLVLLSRDPRVPASTRAPTLVLLVLFALQTVMPSLRDQYPLVAAFHAVNALVIFAVAIVVARRASVGVPQRAGRAEP
jgi:mercuric ion transport protein